MQSEVFSLLLTSASTGVLSGDHIDSLTPLLRSVVARLLSASPQHPDVDDIVQESLRRVVEASRVQPLDSSRLRPWAVGVARHVALDHLRSRQRNQRKSEPQDALDNIADRSRSPLDNLLDRARQQQLEQALETLPNEIRQALMLFHIDGLSYKEIASRLGVPIGTVATWVTRGRKSLAAVLGTGGPAENQ